MGFRPESRMISSLSPEIKEVKEGHHFRNAYRWQNNGQFIRLPFYVIFSLRKLKHRLEYLGLQLEQI
jgi:hypothetical protein